MTLDTLVLCFSLKAVVPKLLLQRPPFVNGILIRHLCINTFTAFGSNLSLIKCNQKNEQEIPPL